MDYYDLDKAKTFLISQKALIVRDGRLLILKLPLDFTNPRDELWELPGGLLEMDEESTTGLEREVMEETGLKVAIGKPISISYFWMKGFRFRDGRTLDARIVVSAFMCQLIDGSVILSHENSDYCWATRQELTAFRFHSNSATAVVEYLVAQPT
jgi:8-oxo-dGTP pyrophosphatase MutT (NUDIX family)